MQQVVDFSKTWYADDPYQGVVDYEYLMHLQEQELLSGVIKEEEYCEQEEN